MNESHGQWLERCSEAMKAAANANRLRFLLLLESGPREAREASEALGMYRALLDAHMAPLAASGLVTVARGGCGTTNIYAITPEGRALLDAMRAVCPPRWAAEGGAA